MTKINYIKYSLLMGKALEAVEAARVATLLVPPEGSVLGEKYGERAWITPEGHALHGNESGVSYILCHELELEGGVLYATFRPRVVAGDRTLDSWVKPRILRVEICQVEPVWTSQPLSSFGCVGYDWNSGEAGSCYESQWGTHEEVQEARKALLAALLG